MASSTTTNGVKHDKTTAPSSGTAAQAVVCVFCGASPGTSPADLEATRSLARSFHEHNIKLVYGGGTVGVMGELAKSLVALSGPDSVHGIIPEPLLRMERTAIDEKMYGRTTVVETMHIRKNRMAQEVLAGGPGSGFVALTGGWGTMEELMEVITWNQLGIHDCPIVVYNVEGYYDAILQWARNAVGRGFITEDNASILGEARTSDGVVEKLQNYKASEGRFKLKWDQK